VYVVTSAARRSHEDIAHAAVDGGATAVQLRASDLDEEGCAAVAARIAAVCGRSGVVFIVNDRVDVAVQARADGAHVGQSDDPASARRRLGRGGLLGVSVEDADQARAAEALGADYLAITVWPTRTKPEAIPRGIDGLRSVVRSTTLPVVAIGGLHAGNAAEVIAAGASGVAVVSAVADATDPTDAVRAIRRAVDDAVARSESEASLDPR